MKRTVFEIGDRVKMDKYTFSGLHNGFTIGIVSFVEDRSLLSDGVNKRQWCKFIIEYYVRVYKGEYFNILQKIGKETDFFSNGFECPKIIRNNCLNLPKDLKDFDYKIHL